MVEGHVSVRACGFESRPGHFTPTRVAKLVDAQSSGGCAFGRAGSSPVPGTEKALAQPGLFFAAQASADSPRIPMRNPSVSPLAAYLYRVVTNNPIGAPHDTSITGVKRPFLISGPCSAESSSKYWTPRVHCSIPAFTYFEQGFGNHAHGPMHSKASGNRLCTGLQPRGVKPASR